LPVREHFLGGLERVADFAEPWLAPRRRQRVPRYA
jgi:hypothetical protein